MRTAWSTFVVLIATSCRSLPEVPALLEARMQAVPDAAPGPRARAECATLVRAEEARRERIAGCKPGPGSIRFPYRCGRVVVRRGARVAVSLCEAPEDFVVPRVVQLYEDSGERFAAGELFLGYSGDAVEVYLAEIVGSCAVGVLVAEPTGRTVRPGDEAWCMPW